MEPDADLNDPPIVFRIGDWLWGNGYHTDRLWPIEDGPKGVIFIWRDPTPRKWWWPLAWRRWFVAQVLFINDGRWQLICGALAARQLIEELALKMGEAFGVRIVPEFHSL